MHTELIVAGRRLHIDVITGTRYGPGRSFIEYRIYIDGRLEGRGGFCGCSLGFGGGERDAVAHVTDQLVVRVEGSSGGGLQHGLEQPPVIAVSRVASVWRRALTS